MATDELMTGSRPRREGAPRRSGTRAVVFWVVALTAGALSALMLKAYVSRRSQVATPALAKVAVAAMDLPVATTLRADQVQLVDWPQAAQPSGAIHDSKEVVGRVLVSRVLKGEPLLQPKLAARDAGRGLAALIPNDMRAVAVRVDDVVGVAGFIHPEDRVDVIVTLRPTKPMDAEPTSKVILQNVKVLAVGKDLDEHEGARSKALPATVATLLVAPNDAEKLALAASQGKLLLALRSWTDSATPETEGVAPTGLLGAGKAALAASNPPTERTRSATRRRDESSSVAAVTPTASEPPKKDIVEILRGDRFEERKFDVKEKQ